MCGLIGYVGKNNVDKVNLLHLMSENDSRGGHSTGFYDGKDFHKCVGSSEGLIESIRENKSKIIIGHTRYATHGEHTVENQHPYQYGKVIGAHNGVVSNYIEVGDKYDLSETVVDSQMIFKVLNHTKDSKSLGLFSGTLATLFTNSKADTMYAYRKGNPLFVGQNGDEAYFSSLREPLENIGCQSIWQLKEGYLYEFNKEGNVKRKVEIEHKPVPSSIEVNTDWRSYGGYNMFSNRVTSNQPVVNTTTDEDEAYDSTWNEEMYVETLCQQLQTTINELQSLNINPSHMHTLEETLDFMYSEVFEYYK